MRMKFDRAIGWNTLFHEGAEGFADLHRILLMHEAERDLGGSFRCDNGLEAFAGIAAGDAVDFRSRARPGELQNAATFSPDGMERPIGPRKFSRCGQGFPRIAGFATGFLHAFIETRNGDASGFVMQVG